MKTLLVFILALTAWAHPIHAASALLQEPKRGDAINVRNESRPNEQVLRNNAQSKAHKAIRDTSNQTIQPRYGVLSQTTYNGRYYSPEEVQDLIRGYSAQFGIDAGTPLCIARAESGFNQFSKNKRSTASGVFQYLGSTWRGTDEGKAGLSVFDADANVRAAVKYMAVHHSTSPWVTRGICPPIK